MLEVDALYEAYYEDVYQWMYWKCGNRHLALDLTQDTFLQVIKSLFRYEQRSSERTWIMGIAKHVWLDHLRKKKVEVVYDDAYIQPATDNDIDYDMSELFMRLKAINQKQYDLVTYRLQGYSHAEIAKLMQCSEASIRVLFHRCKKWMREEIERSEQDESHM